MEGSLGELSIGGTQESDLMEAPDSAIRLLVGATLPVSAAFGRENFAGDPVVREFFNRAKKTLDVDPQIFVSWSCPPDVFIIKSSLGNVLVRSERFDTLLAEYFHLKDLSTNEPSPDILDQVYNTTILRWMFEFFLGSGDASYALSAMNKAHQPHQARLQKIPFRDLSLASLPELHRAAIQCFCLAHEMSHLVQDKTDDPSLFTVIDGRRLIDHLTDELESAGLEQDIRDKMLGNAESRIDAANLIQEINADLIAVELVCFFLFDHFNVSFEDAIHAALNAFEAQCFLHAAKHSCSLLKKYGRGSSEHSALLMDDWLASTQIALRARCFSRRSGIIWAKYSEPNEILTADKINRYVPRIDAMIAGHQKFLVETSDAFHNQLMSLFQELPPRRSDQNRALLAELIDKVRSSKEIRLDIFHALIAMGFSGSTNVIRYFENVLETKYPR